MNPHGGQLSEGRTHGFGFLYEAVAQLRHEAGERQVRGAATAVVTSGGGTPSGVLLLRARRSMTMDRDASTRLPPSVSSDGDKPNGPRSRKGVQTRARLVAAAKEVFEESGFLDARISDIAERAGLSHGSFYHYFESKEEVFREVAATVDELLAAPQRTVVLDPSSRAAPEDRIHEAMRRYLESYRDEAKIVGVIEQVSRYDEAIGALRLARHRRYVQEMAGSIRQLQQRDRADRRIDPEIVAAALGALTTRFAESWLVEGAVECSFADAVDQLTLVFVNTLGLGAGAERPPGATTD